MSMIKIYTPTKDEIMMVKMKNYLYPSEDYGNSQKMLEALLVHKIYHFNYNYHREESYGGYHISKSSKQWIYRKIGEIKNPITMDTLHRAFTTGDKNLLIRFFDWGKYLGKETEYVKMCWSGRDEYEVRAYLGIMEWLGVINQMVVDCGAQFKVAFSDNVPLAAARLREEVRLKGHQDKLKAITVPNALWDELDLLSEMYQYRVFNVEDFIGAKPYSIELESTNKGDVLRVSNVYIFYPKPVVSE